MLYEERDAEKLKPSSIATNNGDGVNHVNHVNHVEVSDKEVGIRLTDASAKWNPQLHDNTLNKLTLNIKPGSLIAVIGPVGAGKVRLKMHEMLKC